VEDNIAGAPVIYSVAVSATLVLPLLPLLSLLLLLLLLQQQQQQQQQQQWQHRCSTVSHTLFKLA
jgi:hypothetical protein